ncbi:expressed unknown protein [Seminavis robusta]|uniref:Uncharacterized protein n=1 Tax=Seminavis robusta TaxID=568900 RepID=A0A9N8HIV0_9STRA|nr:expressed unknown protein [Seminavis robusta]|eukprot:Sro810_g205850.1 n/a (424) ;mRNA; r:45457-46728
MSSEKEAKPKKTLLGFPKRPSRREKNSADVDLENYHVHTSPEDQQQNLWNTVKIHSSSSSSSTKDREWPTYDAVISHVTTQDYRKHLTCPFDTMTDKTKTICPHGAVCCAKMELFPFPQGKSDDVTPYSGLLTPGTTAEHCMIRLSSAIRPLDQGVESDFARTMVRNAVGEKLAKAKIVPGAAIKVFRGNNVPSGNLLFLGSKVGQREEDFFAHCVCTTMTEKMPSVALPFMKRFTRYSKFPLSLGVSDFAKYDVDGNDHSDGSHNFPFAVTLQPVYERSAPTTATTTESSTNEKTKGDKKKKFATFDSFIDEVTHIPVGTTLFDIYASPDPESVGDPTRIQRIGRITTTSEMIPSSPHDGLYFRHEVKEQDYDLRPEWKKGIERKMAMDQGKTKGTVGKLAGWRLFEEDIALQKYVDFGAST